VDFRDDALLLQLVIGTGRWSGWCLRARAAVVRRGMRAAVVPPLTLALIARLRESRCRAISLPRPLAVPPRPLAGRVQDNAARAAGPVVGVEPARGAAVITKRRGAVAAPAFAYKRNKRNIRNICRQGIRNIRNISPLRFLTCFACFPCFARIRR